MKARAIARTVILATALALGVSCKRPLVEGPRIAKTSHRHIVEPHPCTRKVIEGGVNSSCHILFQDHPSLLTKKITKKEVCSQILLYHVLSDLIKNYGARLVFLEGVGVSEDLRKAVHAKCNEKCLNRVRALFERCTNNTDRLSCGYDQTPCRTFPRWFDKRGAEDFCLARILGYDYRNKNLHTILLILHHPSVFFTGFERNRGELFQKVERHRLLLRLREYIELAGGPKMRAEFEALVLSAYIENIVKPRNKYVDRDAINEVILRSSQNSALVIGADHRDAMENTIRTIPFHERPTFYFVMPECQDVPAFFVSPQIINLAVKTSPKNKQNL